MSLVNTTNFKDTKEAIVFANEYIIGGGFFNSINLKASSLISNYGTAYSSDLSESIDIVEHLYEWSLTPIRRERTRLFYLFGDFGSGKSGVCKSLIKKLYDDYELSRYGDTIEKPVLPIYLNLSVLTGIYGSVEFANKSLAELIEVMFCFTGIPPIDGNDLIKLVRQYPCVVVFDGFDEAVQKLGKNQQNGFLNKLLSMLPDAQYTRDLMRIVGQHVEESTIPDSHSRIVISCRKQLFESKQEQTTFTEAFYSTELSINGIHNYQVYELNNINSTTAKYAFNAYFRSIGQQYKQQQLDKLKQQEDDKYFEQYLSNELPETSENDEDEDENVLSILKTQDDVFNKHKTDIASNQDISHQDISHQENHFLDLSNEEVKSFLEYLTNFSSNPLLLSLSKSLLPSVKSSIENTGSINSAQMFTDLITRLMQRDSRKSVINIKEKQKILGALAEKMWQQRTTFISLENLRTFFFDRYSDYRQLQTGIDTGRIEIETAFQDLHSSMLVRDDSDMYAFCQPLIFDYFVAVGIFEAVLTPKYDTTNNIAQSAVEGELAIDSLIFTSHMAQSLIVRRDSISYNRFYDNWLGVCHTIIEKAKDTDSQEASVAKAHEMWEVVIGEVLLVKT